MTNPDGITGRICWEDDPTVIGYRGCAGTAEPVVFEIWRRAGRDEWTLFAELPGAGVAARRGTDPDELKAEAERWLERFVASLGASFRDEPAKGSAAREGFKRQFGLQQQARDLGRDIMTGGGFRGSSHYGAVRATYPQGSRVASEDSWRCHHAHPDTLSALECALKEVRRLASGGSYAPCSAGEDCPDEDCRRDWARLLRDETA